MWLALLLVAGVADWVPARWISSDPASLDLLAATPVNCLLLERPHWSAAFSRAAAARGIATLGVVGAGETAALAESIRTAQLDGVVLEGEFPSPLLRALSDAKILTIELPPRVRIRLDADTPVVGTAQAVWPGINAQDDGHAKAAPSGAPWIDTNSGFLRFLRSATRRPVWIANRPPPNALIPGMDVVPSLREPRRRATCKSSATRPSPAPAGSSLSMTTSPSACWSASRKR